MVYDPTENITFSSDMTVQLIDFMGGDSRILQAARVSTVGELSSHSVDGSTPETKSTSRGLIRYLMEGRHGSPFEHSVFTFFVKAPIFVWREIMRHRIASYNEESGRYKTLAAEFYLPDSERDLVQSGKPGHYQFHTGSQSQHDAVYKGHMAVAISAYQNYQHLLDLGIAREVARMTLPLNIYSSAYITINARSLMNFLSLRVKEDDPEKALFPSYPQKEINMVADLMESQFFLMMPLTHEAFIKNKRVSP